MNILDLTSKIINPNKEAKNKQSKSKPQKASTKKPLETKSEKLKKSNTKKTISFVCSIEQKKLLKKFESQYKFQRSKYIQKGILDKLGKYKCEIPGIHLNKIFKLPSWKEISSRFSPEKLEVISTLNEPIFNIYPLGKRLNTIGRVMLDKHHGISIVADEEITKEEDLHYYVKSVNENGVPSGGKTFDALMNENRGFLISVCDGADEMPAPKYKGNYREKMIAHLDEMSTQNKTSITYQQYLAIFIHRLFNGKKYLDNQNWTCTSGSLHPRLSFVPFVVWFDLKAELSSFNADLDFDYWRARSGVVV